MLNFQKLSLFILLMLLFLLMKLMNVTGKKQYCSQKCGKVHIQFPFYLRNSKFNHSTDFPLGFGLLCNEKDETLLELPSVPVQLFVRNIDYHSHQIQIYDPENCLPNQLLKLGNASISPFQSPLSDSYIYETNVSFFRCDSMSSSCPILLLSSNHDVNMLEILSCTKLKDFLFVEWSIKWVDLYLFNYETVLMEWSKPNCSHCEAQVQQCKWKNGSNGETECFVCPTNRIPTSTILLIAAGGMVVLMLLWLLITALIWVYHYNEMKGQDRARIEKFLEDYGAMNPTRFTYANIKRITNGFSESIGEGAHGTVFKGMLSREIQVAVKIFKEIVGDGKDFINEVGIIGKIHHVNVVRLLGYCAEETRHALVYDFFPHGSLQRYLAPPDKKDVFLGWEKLQQIALGVARGIEYLHLGCDHRILHFDINPLNVLLYDDFIPKITDFGLAKLCPKNQSTVIMSTTKGTLGYIAPEVFSRNYGNVSYKSDIYSYGMLLLEIVGGRKNTNVSAEKSFQVLYPKWIYNLLEGRDVHVIIEDDEDVNIVKKLAIVGLWCIQWNPMDRPSIKNVVQMLEGDGNGLVAPPSPFDIIDSSGTNVIVPAVRQNFELEIFDEIEE